MPAATFRVEFAPEAIEDLYEIEACWVGRGEAWRAEKYFRDLSRKALSELSNAIRARRGRPLEGPFSDGAQEILVFGIYRIIYELDEAAATVNVLRFWHAHRDTPGDEA